MLSVSIVLIIIIAVVATNIKRHKKEASYKLPANAKQLLHEHVVFYNKLDTAGKTLFEERIRDFLAHTTITGVGVQVEDIDRILIASSAIIPIAAFPDWRYKNISEVLLYKNSFNKEYQTEGAERNVLGMVGNGALQGQMILSQESLRQGFDNASDGHNTAIHEFVHLIDKADGATDGVPEYLLPKEHIKPWLHYMHETISKMRATGHSDINLYGATNEAEFFAVISEYFFEQPEKLKEHHPELYGLLEEMFRQN